MKTSLMIAGTAGLVLGLVSVNHADRVYPFFEISDEDLGTIDLHDGSVDDWLALAEEPTATAREFVTDPRWESYDPASLDSLKHLLLTYWTEPLRPHLVPRVSGIENTPGHKASPQMIQHHAPSIASSVTFSMAFTIL